MTSPHTVPGPPPDPGPPDPGPPDPGPPDPGPPDPAGPGPRGEGCSRLGEWLFVPPPADDRDGAAAFLERGGEQVRLEHSARLVADFARLIRQIESDFTRRSGARAARTGG
ncbi:hypothetical protein [Streptomyces sp. NPDC001380]|uniref:hypothetical protein n=1 Tax=Streptomyces sp. NPDC001380 TaxID=3364566 RepID=UPI0036A3A49C